MNTSPVSRSMIFVDAPMNTPIEMTEPSSTTTPSATSERAPMKTLSSIITGPACKGSKTPPIPTPPEIWQFFPICAQEPTVLHVSIIVPSSTYAPTLIKLGSSTTPFATYAEWRTTQSGTARNPAFSKSFSLQPLNLLSTLSYQPPLSAPPEIARFAFKRKESNTAFLSHWFTSHLPVLILSAMRNCPESSNPSAVSTALRTSPFVAGLKSARVSHAWSIMS